MRDGGTPYRNADFTENPEALVNENGHQIVENIPQDNTSPWNDFYFVQQIGTIPTTLTAAVPDPVATPSRILSVASIADISIGDWIGLFSGVAGEERYYWAEVMDIVGLDLEMQTLIDYPFPIGAIVISTTKNMAVDGSVTPQVFSIQAGGLAGILEIDITRVMMAALCENPVNLGTFVDIAGGLTRGQYMRVKENGVFRNKGIYRTNFDLKKFAFDWDPFQAINPNQGQDGMGWRFSINGMDKHGAVARVSGGNIGTLQWVIQDNEATITLLESVGANHEVTP